MIEDGVIEYYLNEHTDASQVQNDIELLFDRCNKNDIKYDFFEDNDELIPTGNKGIIIYRNAGRDSIPVIINSYKKIQNLLSFDFENYNFLNPYKGVCSYEHDVIECLCSGSISTIRSKLNKKANTSTDDNIDDIPTEIEMKSDDGKLHVFLMKPSVAASTLLRSSLYTNNKFSFVIKGSGITKYDDAIVLLKKLSSSIFFEIDLAFGVVFELQRAERKHIIRGRTKEQLSNDFVPSFPKNEYDEAPLTLYWYGRNARNMPLLQFLSFYQVVEFYFPIYLQTEVKKRIKKILKDPTFREDKDSDIHRIINVFQGKNVGYADERTMLKSTINECIDPNELRKYIESIDKMKESLSAKIKGVTDHKIPIANNDIDLRNDIAERVYDIRCKIVHTKDDGVENSNIILPFSQEAELLYYDILLIQYISQQVLINSNSSLKL